MRIRKDSIRGRVKADLPIVFTEEKLSAYGGIELFRRFVDRSGFARRLKKVFSIREFDGDYGSFRITLALMGMLLLGGTRLRHLRILERDPLFLRFARLHRLPTDRTVSNTLKETTQAVNRRSRRTERAQLSLSSRCASRIRCEMGTPVGQLPRQGALHEVQTEAFLLSWA